MYTTQSPNSDFLNLEDLDKDMIGTWKWDFRLDDWGFNLLELCCWLGGIFGFLGCEGLIPIDIINGLFLACASRSFLINLHG